MSKRKEIDPEFRIWLIEECLAGRMRGREAARLLSRVNPKFCVKSNKCMNGAKFICRRQRLDRLPPMSTT